MQKIDWDMATITAGDYTVEMEISEENYIYWKNNSYQRIKEQNRDISPALALKMHIISEIEANLDAWVRERSGVEPDKSSKKKKKAKAQDSSLKQCKIADVVFSFNNRKLILALRERGSKIAYQDWEGLRKCDKEVQDLFQEFDTLTVPTSCFVTFDSDDYKEHALDYDGEGKVLGQKMEFKDASEPTDIIWENRHFTRADYVKRQLCAFSVIFSVLFISFIIIFAISKYAARIAAVFPAKNCADIQDNYGDSLEQYAIKDYNYIVANDGKGVQSSGTLPCFCKQQMKTNENFMSDTFGTDAAICGVYFGMAGEVYLWTTALSYFLIGLNYVLREVCIRLVNWVGYPTETIRLAKTTSVTFYVQFFNSGLLLLLINANLSE